MNKNHASLLMLVFFALNLNLKAQTDTSSSEPPKANSEYGWYHKNAIALNAGLPGIGIEYARNLNIHFNLRARVNTFTLSNYARTFDLSGQSVQTKTGADVLNAGLFIEYLPFKRSSFKLVGGVSYLADFSVNSLVEYDGQIEFGEIVLTKEDIGNVEVGLDWSGVAPYIGLGFGRAVPRGRWGFGFELGTFYAGSPTVSLASTGMLSDTSQEKDDLERGFKDYAWLPYLQLRLAYKF